MRSVLCEQDWLRQKNAAQPSFVTSAVWSRPCPFSLPVPPQPNTRRSAPRPFRPTSRFTDPGREGPETPHKFHLKDLCLDFVQQTY